MNINDDKLNFCYYEYHPKPDWRFYKDSHFRAEDSLTVAYAGSTAHLGLHAPLQECGLQLVAEKATVNKESGL